MSLVIADAVAYPDYDTFEFSVSTYFNNAYFDSLCSNDPSSSWLLNFVDEKCPERMSQEFCALSERKKKTCDTFCPETYDLMMCCPSEELCNDGAKVSCPYHRCRVEILEELHLWAA